MKKPFFLVFLILLGCSAAYAQNTLPNFSVKNVGGKIIVSWRNAYTLPISNLKIQRSYDSLRNFTTVGSVLNPENLENGYLDANAPYNKMYYKIFVSFEGGAYLYTESKTPQRDIPYKIIKTADGRDSIVSQDDGDLEPYQVNPLLDSNLNIPPPGNSITPQSKLIYPGKDDVILNLPFANIKNYLIRFYNDKQQKIFEIKNPRESYLMIEKVNFGKSGLYTFDIFEDGVLIEKNSVLVPKDSKKN